MLIAEFFREREIFITGGSGFIGKALIEKLLRSCPALGKIWLLVRSKKGKDATLRLRELLASTLYDRLRAEQPDALNKVHAIEGDCMALGLGISAADLQRLTNVTVVYHSAASVRFDDSLRDAILMNTRSTHELVKLALGWPHLLAFVHVSTTYCHPKLHVVEERVYQPPADWRIAIKLAETFDAETLNVLNLKYSNYQPNTYTFTKSLAEQIIDDYKHELPMLIFRPSIVIATIEDPVPGWADNFNGPTGMLVACGIGILRTNCADPDTVMDFVPVDIVVRCMIIAAYRRGFKTLSSSLNDELEVINCATANICAITTGEVIDIGKKYILKNPFEKTLWVPGGSITRCVFWHYLRFFTLQLMISIIVDGVLRLSKEKPFLMKLQRRICAANMALIFFLTREWEFKNANFRRLQEQIPDEEIPNFSFLQHSNFDYVEFFRNGIRGARQYLLNEPPDSSDGARIRLKIFQMLHLLIQLIAGYVVLRWLYKRITLALM